MNEEVRKKDFYVGPIGRTEVLWETYENLSQGAPSIHYQTAIANG